MRYILFLYATLLLTSCNSNKNYQKPKWLIGKWIRVNNEASNKTYEIWKPDFAGLGYTLQEKDTTFIENMNVISYNKQLYLQIIGMDRTPSLFEFTAQSNKSFTAENKQNSFPNKIKYELENDTLKTIISNNEFSVDFKFVKLDE